MGNWKIQQIKKQENQERDRSRRETLGKFFYDLAKLTFAGLVIGSIAPLYMNIENANYWYTVLTGSILTIIFASIGNRILK